MNPTIGLAVITKNEEKNIEACLDSVPFANTKIVIDSQSTDRTVELAQISGAKVIVREWPGYPKQKQFALDQIDCDWILVLDADEVLTSEAQEEIKNLIAQKNTADAYRVPRYEYFMNRVIRHGKGVDFPVRLIKRGKGTYTDREVHEEIIVNGTCDTLKHGMVHRSSVDIKSRLEKIKRDLTLEQQYLTHERISLSTLFAGPLIYFFSYYLKKKAWKDGAPGTIWLVLFTFQIFLHQAIQFERSMIEKKS